MNARNSDQLVQLDVFRSFRLRCRLLRALVGLRLRRGVVWHFLLPANQEVKGYAPKIG